MNRKLVFGIGLPILIIVTLVILSSSNIGYSETITTVKVVSTSALVSRSSIGSTRPIQTINITNDLFISRSYELKGKRACLYDKEGVEAPYQIYLQYSDGTFLRQGSDPFLGVTQPLPGRLVVEVPAESKKTIYLFAQHYQIYQGQDENQFSNYDELLIQDIESNSDLYYGGSCYNIDPSKAVHIALARDSH